MQLQFWEWKQTKSNFFIILDTHNLWLDSILRHFLLVLVFYEENRKILQFRASGWMNRKSVKTVKENAELCEMRFVKLCEIQKF